MLRADGGGGVPPNVAADSGFSPGRHLHLRSSIPWMAEGSTREPGGSAASASSRS